MLKERESGPIAQRDRQGAYFSKRERRRKRERVRERVREREGEREKVDAPPLRLSRDWKAF